MMKAKISRGASFKGILEYALKNEKSECISGTLISQNPKDLAEEFSTTEQLRPDIKKQVWHCSLSLPKDEKLTNEKWSDISKDFMERMGFDSKKTLYSVVRHSNTDYDHVHIVASRVNLDGHVWLGQSDVHKAIKVTQELEIKNNLRLTKGFEFKHSEKKALSDNEINMAIRTQLEPSRQKLQKIIDQVVKNKPTALEFTQNLELAGVNVRVNLASTGRLNGFSFELDGIPFKGQDLGDAYKWGSLQKRGVTYKQERDRIGLERYKTTIAARGTATEISERVKFDSGHFEETSRSVGESAEFSQSDYRIQKRDQEDSRRLRETFESAKNEFGHTVGENQTGNSKTVRPENDRGCEIFGKSQRASGKFENSGKGYSDFRAQLEVNGSSIEVFGKESTMEENRNHDSLCFDRSVSHDVHEVFFQRFAPVERGEITHSIREKFDQQIDTKGISGNETNCRSTSKINPEKYLESQGFNVKSNGYSESAFQDLTIEGEEEKIDLKMKTPSERIAELLGQDQKSKKQRIGVSYGRSM